jgi:hypothetical protein
MIIRVKSGLEIHKNRCFIEEEVADTFGGELAETVKDLMLRDRSIVQSDDETDAKLITGKYTGYWICVEKNDFEPVSPLELLAMEAE